MSKEYYVTYQVTGFSMSYTTMSMDDKFDIEKAVSRIQKMWSEDRKVVVMFACEFKYKSQHPKSKCRLPDKFKRYYVSYTHIVDGRVKHDSCKVTDVDIYVNEILTSIGNENDTPVLTSIHEIL